MDLAALPAMLIVQLVRVVPLCNVLHANQVIFCSHQPPVRALVPRLAIGQTLQITFASLAILLAMTVRAQATLNALLATQGILNSLLLQQQLVLTLVHLDFVRTPEPKLV